MIQGCLQHLGAELVEMLPVKGDEESRHRMCEQKSCGSLQQIQVERLQSSGMFEGKKQPTPGCRVLSMYETGKSHCPCIVSIRGYGKSRDPVCTVGFQVGLGLRRSGERSLWMLLEKLGQKITTEMHSTYAPVVSGFEGQRQKLKKCL